jgi:hypothetical protein
MNGAQHCIQSLLIGPRIVGEDYLFYNDGPFAAPPGNIQAIGDINTGQAYIKTHRKLAKDPTKQVLLPIIFYIGGTSTGQFANLPATPLKMTLGIFNRAARDRPHMWRTLGYVPYTSTDAARGKRKLQESGHVGAIMQHQDLAEGEGNLAGATAVKAQDLHSMLSVILEEYVKIQDSGFVWDLVYKGKLHRGIEFAPYAHFFKCGTDEADKLCGQYTSRGVGIKLLCRYCCCPGKETDNPRAKYPHKTPKMIASLAKKRGVEGLRNLSQQDIENACYV